MVIALYGAYFRRNIVNYCYSPSIVDLDCDLKVLVFKIELLSIFDASFYDILCPVGVSPEYEICPDQVRIVNHDN